MKKTRAFLALVVLAAFAVGCESEAPKKPPEQSSDLGAPASPNSAPDNPAAKPPGK